MVRETGTGQRSAGRWRDAGPSTRGPRGPHSDLGLWHNHGDIKKRQDSFGLGMPYPRAIPHSDGAGVVDLVGDGISAESCNSALTVVARWFPRTSCDRAVT